MQSEKRLVKMTRKDLTDHVLEVEHSDGTERWLVVKTTLHPKKVTGPQPDLRPVSDALVEGPPAFHLKTTPPMNATEIVLDLTCEAS